MQEVRQNILKDWQIKKFCAYGFLKNLKFFEPYLIIFLLNNQLNLTQIGFLIAIREVIINVFEIPSGFIADYFGRKKELYFCFAFYIISFVFFFNSNQFLFAVIAMVFFGLGEAFRSGTHKAMIYTYLESKNWQSEKTFVYGRTRSFSLIGSAISSLFGILIILSVPKDNYIFLFSTIPYLLDFALIVSYPQFLDCSDKDQSITLKGMIVHFMDVIKNTKSLKLVLIQEGMTESSVSYVKNLIQPILEAAVLGSGIVVIANLTADQNLKIILGVVYAIINLFGSYFSKKAYLLRNKKTAKACLMIFHVALAILFAMIAICAKSYILVAVAYILLYIVHSMRKPIFVDEIDNLIDKSTRATFLSVAAQLKSLMLMIIAPALGFVADNYGIVYVMWILSLVFLLSSFVFCRRR